MESVKTVIVSAVVDKVKHDELITIVGSSYSIRKSHLYRIEFLQFPNNWGLFGPNYFFFHAESKNGTLQFF